MRISSRALFCAALLVSAVISTLHAGVVITPTLVVAQGDAIGSTGLKLEAAGPPAIDSDGQVAFHATVSGTGIAKANDSVMLLYGGLAPAIVARTGTLDPITGGTFTKFSDPDLSGSGAMAFLGTLRVGGTFKSTNDEGLYVYESGTLSLPVRKGDLDTTDFNIPVAYDSFAGFNVDDAGGVTFVGNIEAEGTTTKALYGTLLSGSLNLVVYLSDANSDLAAPQFNLFQSLKLVDGQGRSLSPENGNVSIYGDLGDNKESFGLALNGTAGFNGGVVLSAGGTAPFAGTKIKSFDEPAISTDASAVMKMTLTGTGVTAANDSAIVETGSEGSATYITDLRTGSTATDGTGGATDWVYTKFSDPVINNNDDIAFIGTLKTSSTTGVTTANDSGIWSNWNGTLELVARTGEAAPGTTGTFAAFTQLVLPDLNGPYFVAKLSGVHASANTGLWNVSGAQDSRLIVQTGQQLSVHGTAKTVKSFTIFPVVPYTGGQTRSFDPASRRCVFEVTFTDKTWAIYMWPAVG